MNIKIIVLSLKHCETNFKKTTEKNKPQYIKLILFKRARQTLWIQRTTF
jgi:hypothetical protein